MYVQSITCLCNSAFVLEKILETHGVQFLLLLHYMISMAVSLERGRGSPRGWIPRSGTGMGETQAPTVVTGTGMENICPRGDGDGEPSPDGEFPVAIFTRERMRHA
jgi:hypothetical protein